MQQPLQITFRDIPPSEAVEADIREKAAKLDLFFDKIMTCRVMVESPHTHKHKGHLYHVRVDLTVPGGELIANRSPAAHQAHEDIYVAVRDAFDAAKRQLQEYKRKLKGNIKSHDTPAHGQVMELNLEQDYGRLQTSDGRDVYFHRNSLVRGDFEDLEVGAAVHFVEEMGEQGPQASSLYVEGKHHIHG